MGKEAVCHAKFGRESGQGLALLETDELVFRGEFRVSVPLKEITAVAVKDGRLAVEWAGGRLSLELGRVDLKTHREAGVLEARHVHFEPWFANSEPPPHVSWGAIDREAVFAGLADSLRSLASHVGVADVKLGRVTPSRWKHDLRRALQV